MALPSPLETVTVRGKWVSPATGAAISGVATLRAVNEVRSPAGDVLLTRSPARRLLVDGVAEWTGVLATDSAGLSAEVTYQVEVFGTGHHERRFVELRKASAVAGVINLADVATSEEPPDLVIYVLASSVGQVGGPAGPLDADGLVPVDQLPDGGGGGAVASVDGRTGTVTLGDLYTDPAELAAGLAGKANTSHTHTASQVTDLTTAVDARVQLIVDAAPAALDTLNELAAALGDDPNFAGTVTTALATKAPLASPTFTGTVAGVTKSMVGLGNVDNTSDAAKPVSTATQTALNLKAPLASPAFTGTPTGITKTHVGLGNVDNTSDANKPVSTAVQAALDAKLPRVQITDPMTKYNLVAASGRFGEMMGSGGFAGQFVIARTFIPAGVGFSRMAIPVRAAGTFTPGSGKPNQLAWWDDSGVLQQVTPDDDTMWSTADWYVANLPAPVVSQAADRYVYAGFQISGVSGAGQYIQSDAIDAGGVPFSHAPGSTQRFAAYSGSLATLGDFNPATVGVLTSFMPFIGFMA